MNILNIKLTGERNLGNAVLLIDGEQTRFRKNKFGNIVASHQTEKEKVKIEVYRALDVGGVLWFITQLFFFIISIFGLFDIHLKQRYMGLVYEAKIELKEENNIVLRCNIPRDNSKVFDVETNLVIEEIENKFYVDEKAKKTLKILLISKIVLALAIIGIAIAIIITQV